MKRLHSYLECCEEKRRKKALKGSRYSTVLQGPQGFPAHWTAHSWGMQILSVSQDETSAL